MVEYKITSFSAVKYRLLDPDSDNWHNAVQDFTPISWSNTISDLKKLQTDFDMYGLISMDGSRDLPKSQATSDHFYLTSSGNTYITVYGSIWIVFKDGTCIPVDDVVGAMVDYASYRNTIVEFPRVNKKYNKDETDVNKRIEKISPYTYDFGMSFSYDGTGWFVSGWQCCGVTHATVNPDNVMNGSNGYINFINNADENDSLWKQIPSGNTFQTSFRFTQSASWTSSVARYCSVYNKANFYGNSNVKQQFRLDMLD